jgi:serine phosphatase RsbU (regulator of sigma subunit)
MVGDVTGRGVEAAALTADARHTLRTAAELLSDTHAALEHLNAVMAVRAEQSLCTAALVLLAEHRGRVTATVLCAGHPAPLLVRRGDVEPLHCRGQIIGAWTDSAWEPRTLELEPGDLLVLYTDGVTDARAGDERFGEARLVEAVRSAEDESDAVRRISDALAAFEQGPQADDTAVLALRRAA